MIKNKESKLTYSKTTKITFGDAKLNGGIPSETSGKLVFSKTSSWSTGGFVKANGL